MGKEIEVKAEGTHADARVLSRRRACPPGGASSPVRLVSTYVSLRAARWRPERGHVSWKATLQAAGRSRWRSTSESDRHEISSPDRRPQLTAPPLWATTCGGSLNGTVGSRSSLGSLTLAGVRARGRRRGAVGRSRDVVSSGHRLALLEVTGHRPDWSSVPKES
jgi:hypothetical protein